MQSSKRTLRSHEIPVPQSILINAAVNSSTTSGSANNSTSTNTAMAGNGGNSGAGNTNTPFFETELDLHFSLQYPHFIKRDGNRSV